MAKQSFSVGQVLTAAQMTSLQQTAMLGGAASAKTTSYTLVAADAGTSISMTSTSATTITINTGLFAAGDTVQITNLGTGICTITAGTATVNTSASLALAQYESGTLDFDSTSSAIFIKGASGSGGMTLLATTTLSGTSTVVSSIPQTYNSLVIVGTGLTWSANAHFYINPNSTASNVEAVGNYDGGYIFATNIAPLSNGTIASSASNGFVAQISNYTITSRKPVLFYGNHASGSRASNFGGACTHSSAITSLQYTTAAGTATLGGTIYLYGVK